MSENRESGLNVTGAVPNTNVIQQIQDILLKNDMSSVEKEQMIRQLLGTQVASDSNTVNHKQNKFQSKEKSENQYKKYYNSNDITNDVRNDIDSLVKFPSFGLFENSFDNFFFNRGRRFMGPFDLMEPSFFKSSRLQYDIEKMFDTRDLDKECEFDEYVKNEITDQESSHLKYTSKIVSIDKNGVKRSRVVNGITKTGKDGKPFTHKKMISIDGSGKTVTEVFPDGTERTTKQPYIQSKKYDSD